MSHHQQHTQHSKLRQKNSAAVVVTIWNEAHSIIELLEGLLRQSLLPSEIIIVDGGSSDGTTDVIRQWMSHQPSYRLLAHDQTDGRPKQLVCSASLKNTVIHLAQVKGNRSVGRNAGITLAQAELIAITDAGCQPDKHWLEQLCKEQHRSGTEVVAGNAVGDPNTAFEAAVVPFVLVMPDRVDPQHYLPATRSMLLSKKVWQQVGGFNEALSHNEDYEFAQRLAKVSGIVFATDAIVYWRPRSDIMSFWRMIYRFALGDIQTGLHQRQVFSVFARYTIGLLLVGVAWLEWGIPITLLLSAAGLLSYALFALWKNARYCSHGWYWLPVLQITCDSAVMVGSIVGRCKNNVGFK